MSSNINSSPSSNTLFGLTPVWWHRLEVSLVVFIIAGFLGVASVHLGVLPAPWQDEPWLMQPSYELITHGQLGMPMFRIRGNNIGQKIFDAPVFYLETAAWYRLFGFSLLSARAFNLSIAAIVLLLVYAFARRTQGAIGALLVVALLATEQNYFDIARMFRNDFAALMHAWIAFNLFLWAEKNTSDPKPVSIFGLFTLSPPKEWHFLVAGLAAGLAVQTHLNGLYVFGVFGIWLLMEHGFAFWRSRSTWSIAAGVVIALIPFGIYCLADWSNFAGQWKGTPGRYSALQGGLLANIQHEWRRYFGWGVSILNWGGAQKRLFATWALMGAGFVFAFARLGLALRSAINRKQVSDTHQTLPGTGIQELFRASWMRVLAATLFIMIFFMMLDEPKTANYIPHLSTWYALLVGELVTVVFSRRAESPYWKPASVVLGIFLVLYSAWTGLIFVRYLKWTQSFTPAPYSELAQVLRQTVPPDLTPVGYPTHWLAFTDNPAYLACKSRFWRKLPGKDYVFIVDQKGIASNSRKFPRWLRESRPQFTVLAELENTLYGNITVYYTGQNPKWQHLPFQRYRFFGTQAGVERLPDLPAASPEPSGSGKPEKNIGHESEGDESDDEN